MAITDPEVVEFTYKHNKSGEVKTLPSLSAKSYNETLGSITYIDPTASGYKNFMPSALTGNFKFIPANSGVIKDDYGTNIWGTKAAYADCYKSTSSTFSKLENVAAWGTAPIPRRRGLGNDDSPYIAKVQITPPSTLNLTWGTKNGKTGIIRSDKPEEIFTEASCIIVDLCAAGGSGGQGNGSNSSCSGGGGGGSGAAASIIIDMNRASKITFTNNSGTLYVKDSNSTTFLTLNKGGNGGNGSGKTAGSGGTGGTVSRAGLAPAGVKILWSSAGSKGGDGGSTKLEDGVYATGKAGSSGPNRITFITNDSITWYAGGKYEVSGYNNAAGGGGAGSIFSYGTSGTDYTYPQVRNAVSGAGGGGNGNRVTGTAATGGSAVICFYYETPTMTPYSGSGANYYESDGIQVSDPTEGSNEPSVGCVFPGTQVFIDQNTSVDIVDYEPRSPLDFCDPDTLEHSIQQSPAKLRYKAATCKITLQLEDGKKISVTPNHIILTKDGLKWYLDDSNYQKYGMGDEVATIDGYKKLVSITDENIEKTTVYNIITEHDLMVANGIIIAGELNFDLEAAEARAARAARGISTWALILPGDEESKEIM